MEVFNVGHLVKSAGSCESIKSRSRLRQAGSRDVKTAMAQSRATYTHITAKIQLSKRKDNKIILVVQVNGTILKRQDIYGQKTQQTQSHKQAEPTRVIQV